MRSRLPRGLRRSLDRILTSRSNMGWLRGGIVASLLCVGVMLWDLQRRIAPGIRSRNEEISSLRTLEADLIGLRAKVAPAGDPLERQAWEGVFLDWTELAGWLEKVRADADSVQADLQWRVEEGGAPDARFPQLQIVRVEWTYSPSDPSFRQALGFVHRQVSDRKRLISLESIGMDADEIGVRTVRFRVKTWIRGPRG
ncbi:MAG: hypothetical protein IPK50_10990 [Fibrobacterota bacterium]|nr:hypothetical protein [Fibrobacterota bacterium]QQS07403.1 MAG: hypothetical protein IPK50_10990 [Fibrobacterota bacterium]